MEFRAVLVVTTLALFLVTVTAQEFEVEGLLDSTDRTYLRSGRKYDTVAVQGGLPLGNQTTHHSLFVWRNGIVTFELDSLTANLSNPTRNYSSLPVEYLVAPLWFSDVSQSLVNSTVWWSEDSTEDGHLLTFAENVVNDFSREKLGIEVDFTPTWAIVISWNISLIPRDRRNVCEQYSDCGCLQYYYDDYYYYNYDYYYGTDGYYCSPDAIQCLTDLEYSSNDIDYLHLLCDSREREISDNDLENVEYQMVLTTDEVNTYAISLYQCRMQFLTAITDAFAFIGNRSTTGHRLGDLHDNYTSCIPVENGIADIFRCYSINCNNRYQFDSDIGISSYVRSLTNSFSQFKYQTLHEGFDYIPFLLVDSDNYDLLLDNQTMLNTSNTTVSLSRYQYVSDVIFHSGIRVGTVTHNKIYVGTDGFISFGSPFYLWYPQLFPSPYYWIRESYVIAPFWMDYDIRNEGYIVYSAVHSEDTFDTVNTFLTNQTETDFSADWILIAAWIDAPIYPHSYIQDYPQYYSPSYRNRVLNNKNTFEAIIASSGDNTYAIFTYQCGRLNNGGQYRGAVIGYNTGGFLYENHPLSTSNTANRIACRNTPSSDYFNLIYKLNAGEDIILQTQQQCRRMIAEDEKSISVNEVENYKDLVSPCPCTIRNIWRDRNYRWDNYNFYCYYRTLANEGTGDYDQYCCYSFESSTWGALEKSGYRVSGLAKMQPTRFGRTLSKTDEEMRRVCCGLAGLCDLYLQQRPPNNCSGYVPPIWTWGWGDPHITTLDGHSYTFNGYGDYVMFNYDSEDVEFHARMRPTPGAEATQFSSFAIGSVLGSKVEVNCDSPDAGCTLLYNKTDISLNLTSINDTYYSSVDRIVVTKETDSTVTITLGHGISLAVSYNQSIGVPSFQLNLDPNLSGSMVGLLGNRDGDSENDMILRDGTPISNDPNDQEIFDFGNSWRITTVAESLFSYGAGKGPEDFHDPSWTPVFTNEVLSMARDEVVTACTPPGASQPLEQCVYDAVATNNITVGMATTETLNDNMMAMEESTNMPPNINSNVEGVMRVSFSSPLTFTVTVSDDKDTSPAVALLSPPDGASLTLSSSNTYTFSWTLTALDPQQNISDIVIVASDMTGFLSTYSPTVEVCACLNDGQCTTDGVITSTNIILLNCICPPAWDGRYCEEDVDGCIENGCSEGVDCEDVPAPGEGVICGPCPVGFTDDGRKCADIDECAANLSPCQQVCSNNEGSYECSCYRGYVVDEADPSRCIDNDECSLMTDNCDQHCTNTLGSYNCSCDSGFTSSGPSCFPEEECSSDYKDCGSALCANISGSPLCYCDQGLQLNSSGNGCVDIDECSIGVCQQFCTNIPGTFLCGCNPGFQLDTNLVSCVDVDDCQLALERGEVLCEDTFACYNVKDGTYSCLCAPGLYPLTSRDSSSAECGSLPLIQEFIKHSVRVTFSSITEQQLLNDGILDSLYTLLLSAIREYCNGNECEVEGLVNTESSITKRHAHIYTPSTDIDQPVFNFTGVESRPSGGVSIPFYLLVNEYGVLNGYDTLLACQTSEEEFRMEFGSEIEFSLALPTNITTGQPPVTQDNGDVVDDNTAIIAGVTAAAAVLAVVVSSLLALTLFLCVEWCRKKKNSQSSTDKRSLLTEGVSWPDGKGGGEREMSEVPPQGPRMSEDLGRTVFVNEDI